MEGLDVGNRVHDAAWPQRKGILRVECRRHDARLVLARLEMRIGEANEDFAELVLFEKVGEKLHRVGADAGGVLIELGGLVLLS